MKSAIAYLRKSTDLQETSLEQQKENILAFAKGHDIRVIEIFEEEACGETVEGRPQFRRMIEVCKSGKAFQYVLVYDISRWGRFNNPKEAVYWEVEVERGGRKVVFVSEGFKEESIGTAITNFVKSAEASEYLKNVRRQTIRGMIFKAKQGFWMGGRPPYGYNRAIIEDGKVIEVLLEGKQKNIKAQKVKLVINKKQAKVIKTIFVMFAKQGLSVHSIVTYLNQSQYAAPRGKYWTKSSVWRMLHNEAYIGTLVYNRENGHKRHGRHKYNTKEKWIVVEDAHEPIIPRNLWELVRARTRQAFVGGRFQTKGTRPGSDYLLSGIIKCGHCGFSFHGRRSKRLNGYTKRYRCGGYNMYGNGICSRWDADAEKLEDFVIRHIQGKIDNPLWRSNLRKDLRHVVNIAENKSNDKLHNLDKEIKELSLKIDNWTKAVDKGINLDNVVSTINRYVYKRDQLYQEKRQILTKVNSGNVDKIVDKMMAYLDDFKGILRHGRPERKKDFVRSFVKSCVMWPKRKEAKVEFYKRPMADKRIGGRECEETEEVVFCV